MAGAAAGAVREALGQQRLRVNDTMGLKFQKKGAV
jgi:hypothetical protein